MASTSIKIRGMHCNGCAERVKRVLEREAGVRKAVVTFATGEAQVSFDEQTINADGLRQVIERAGYAAA